MNPLDMQDVERDPRFPSGPWTGFFMQHLLPGRNTMSLNLTFRDGQLDAKGEDDVGSFTFRGTYDLQDGTCRWIKKYRGRHQVSYSGVNEGQGIWGAWEIRYLWGLIHDKGVFHIWPEGMTPSAEADLTERAHSGSPSAGCIIANLIGIGVALAFFLLLRYLVGQWLGGKFP
jgi:hypothetical protein